MGGQWAARAAGSLRAEGGELEAGGELKAANEQCVDGGW
jgi:hypothetical protein